MRISQITKHNKGTCAQTLYDGFILKFDNNDNYYIKIMLSNEKKCDETICVDTTQDINSFIGKEVVNITIEETKKDKSTKRNEIICTIYTSDNDKLQISLINEHNRYYMLDWFLDYNLIINNKLKTHYKYGAL